MSDFASSIDALDQDAFFFLEEDYYVHPHVLTSLTEFWAAYHPCFVVPYDYIDRYTSDGGDRWGGQESILLAAGQHWRTVSSCTVTYALRADVYRVLKKYDVLPQPWSDYEHSKLVANLVGIWAPLPGLAAHRHADNALMNPPIFDYDKFERALAQDALNNNFPHFPKVQSWVTPRGPVT
jgi:hypothetical protein